MSKVCPKCGSDDIGIRWTELRFVNQCRECYHQFNDVGGTKEPKRIS